MKNILLLTDFSENSINAIHYALQLFKTSSCSFYVLHVESSTSYIGDDLMLSGNESIYSSIIKKSKTKLTQLVNELKNDFKTNAFQFQLMVDYDLFIPAIKQFKKSKSIDLIVMGSNGATGAKEVLFGSNTINVIRKVNCPTLVIPAGYKYKSLESTLLPLDAYDSLSGHAFVTVVNFIKQFGQTLHLLRINPLNEISSEAKNDKAHIDYFLQDITYKYHSVTNIPIHYSVDFYIQTNSIDLTFLLVQKEGFFERFFIGSPTTELAHNSRVPLFIIHS